MKVRDKIDAFRGDAALSSWIYRITFNTAMSRLRSTRAARLHEVPDEPVGAADEPLARADRPADWSNLGDELVLRGQLREALQEAVAELPAIYRAPVILRDLRGLSTEEASRRLNVKDQTLKSRLHRGRLILRERLADFAGGLVAAPPRRRLLGLGARRSASAAARLRAAHDPASTTAARPREGHRARTRPAAPRRAAGYPRPGPARRTHRPIPVRRPAPTARPGPLPPPALAGRAARGAPIGRRGARAPADRARQPRAGRQWRRRSTARKPRQEAGQSGSTTGRAVRTRPRGR